MLFSKIERESQEPKITKQEIANVKKSASQFQKMIEINVSPNLKKPDYEYYLSDIILKENAVKEPNSNSDSSRTKNLTNKSNQTLPTMEYSQPNNLIYDPEEEFKCKSLVHLEEKESMDQFVTTTTTVRTRTKDDLFMLFDNSFFGNENHSEEQLNDFFMNRKDSNQLNQGENPKILNINKNVYSCLNNYFSSSNSNEFTTV